MRELRLMIGFFLYISLTIDNECLIFPLKEQTVDFLDILTIRRGNM